jgi:hypothetical protein
MSKKEKKFEILQLEDYVTKKFLVREIKFGVKIKEKKILDLFEGNTILKNIFEILCRQVIENAVSSSKEVSFLRARKIQVTFFHVDLKKPIANSNLELKDLNSKRLFEMVRFNENGQRLDMQNFRSKFEILFTIFNEPFLI